MFEWFGKLTLDLALLVTVAVQVIAAVVYVVRVETRSTGNRERISALEAQTDKMQADLSSHREHVAREYVQSGALDRVMVKIEGELAAIRNMLFTLLQRQGSKGVEN